MEGWPNGRRHQTDHDQKCPNCQEADPAQPAAQLSGSG